MYRFCLTICFSVALGWSFGCTPEPPKGAAPAAKVRGTINMDGKALPTGELHFETTGFPPRVLNVTDGTFSGEAPVGKNQVQLFIYVEGPPSEKYRGVATRNNVAPAKYWGPKTSLDATVNASGPNEFKFDITSK